MTAREIAIAATSCGYAAQSIGGGEAKAQISINAQEIGFGDYNRGIEVAVFDETTGQPLSCTAFDTLIGNSEVFANFIDSLPAGRIVAIAVKGDAIGQTSLSYRAKQALKSVGSAQIDRLQAYQSYTLIGIKGRSLGTARESLAWLETSSSYTFEREAVREGETLAVEAISTPSRVEAPQYIPQGGHAAITLNGNLLVPDGGYQSGWNLGVFDPQDGRVKTSGCFNPWNPADIDRFVQTIADLQAGEIVAIATQNYAGGEVDERVKNACASIGSTAIGQLKYGGSWAIVGERGAAPGQAIENLDNISQYYSQYGAQGVKVKAWLSARQKAVGLASIIVAGDVDIVPPTVSSLGKTLDKNNIKFFTTILGNGNRVLVQQTANFGPSATLENIGIPLHQFYDSLSGVSSRFLNTALEADSLTGVNLFVCIAPQNPFQSDELLHMGRFIEEGGTLFFIGNGGWSLGNRANSNINAAIASLGSTIKMFNNIIYGTLKIANTPLTKGLLSFTYITPSEVAVGDGTVLFAVGRKPFIVAKMR